MMNKFARSWEFSKVSYAILFKNYSLLVFPIISSIALILVTLSFWLPLWGIGFFEHMKEADEATGNSAFFHPLNLVVVFLFYFISYFVIFFFNSALTACAVKALANEEVTVASGLTVAIKRMPQIIAWSLVSAAVGLLLQIVENIDDRVGAIVAALLGTAWSIVTFFTVPVIVVEGFGPISAVKRSGFILKSTWGEGLIGNVSLGLINFFLTIPILIICVILVVAAAASRNAALVVTSLVFSAIALSLFFAATSAAGVIFKAVLYNYATGSALPAGIDKATFDSAFATK